MIPHIIITHFNIRWRIHNRNGLYTLFLEKPDKKWMDHRFELFRKYTYPSVCAQTNQNFDWYVYFDPKNTDADIIKEFTRITPLYVQWEREFDPRRDLVEKLFFKRKLSYGLITTNLDNDDSLNVNYIENIQRWYKEHQSKDEKFLVEFPLGLNYNHMTGDLLVFEEKFGHFMSMIENHPKTHSKYGLELFRTIRYIDHRRYAVYNKDSLVQIPTSEPMSMQVCHNRNAKNSFVLGVPTSYNSKDVKRMFNVTL